MDKIFTFDGIISLTSKEKYSAFCRKHTTLVPVFMQPFWLDTVAEEWDVALEEKDDKITGVLPYCIKGKFITQRIYLPELSFYQSFILTDAVSKTEAHKIILQLFKQLPVTVKSHFKLLPQYASLVPDKTGYSREEYPTYLLTPDRATAPVLSNNHRRNIEKGVKGNYSIAESRDIRRSYQLLISTFAKQHKKAPVEWTAFQHIMDIVTRNNAGKALDCTDKEGHLLASIFILKDASSYYYSMGGYNEAFKNSGGMTCLLWHCIQLAAKENLPFNFCGSAKKSIASYFEGFGASKIPIAIWKKGLIKRL